MKLEHELGRIGKLSILGFLKPGGQAIPEQIDLEIDEQIVPVYLRSNGRARRFVLRVDPKSRAVRLTVPPGGSLGEAKRFAEKQINWIRTRLDRLPAVIPFADGTEIPFRGEIHKITHHPNRHAKGRGRGVIWIEDGEVGYPPNLCVSGAQTYLERRLRDWLKREAERNISHAVWRYAKELEVTVTRISIRDQSSRWGSCSATGVLSFSWRMILAPDFVLEYLAAHEVAHLREMNHSSRFWDITNGLCADTARAKTWLNAHGRDLHGIGS